MFLLYQTMRGWNLLLQMDTILIRGIEYDTGISRITHRILLARRTQGDHEGDHAIVEDRNCDLADVNARLEPSNSIPGGIKTKLQIHQIETTVVTAEKVPRTEINMKQTQRRTYRKDQSSLWMKTLQTGNDKRYVDDVLI